MDLFHRAQMRDSDGNGLGNAVVYRIVGIRWVLVHDVSGDVKGVVMAILVLFYIAVALLSLGMMTLRRWWTLLGIVLFCLNGWAFWNFLELFKR